ncbi:MAG: hypothetical protein NC400_11795, partial [Clostridium sp.]|nr:hypothetical protein [Clostridium sp.]
YRGDISLAYDINAFESNAVSTGEYLYEDSWGPATETLQMPVGVGAEIESFEKRYNTVTLSCKAVEEEAALLMPLYYYPGYEAADLNTGEKFAVERSDDNNRICVHLPDNYQGTLQVRFREPVSWRMAEAVSAGTLAVCLIIIFGFNKKMAEVLERKRREI